MNLNITFNKEVHNKIKFLNPYKQLRVLRHEYSNYDKVITNENWKQVSISFYKQISKVYPKINTIANTWLNDKLKESTIR